ncbi:hypothetical protein RJ640_024227 [Escallonia rubra]|uniref:Uncharacterized protein n=1 Tax=Escallonia rubra TaxID=112253 RepID=A0AA88UJD1_9ASTE|nr:hypothetical protein RJ640_024227 [Escallonia rubra]
MGLCLIFLSLLLSGLFYGRLLGINTYTTKSDVVNMLEGCNLSVGDIKVEYNRAYAPASMLVQFPSKSEYDAAIRTLGRKGRLFKVETADRAQWDSVVPFDGKAVLLQGIPRNALPDDVERFLSGCQYDSSFQLFARQAFPEPIRMAVVRFPSSTLATHAFITKNRGFCLNNQISVRVLQ